MKSYSEDLRQKIVVAVERGMSKSEAARLFDVSLSSVKRYIRMASSGGSLAPKKRPGRTPKVDERTEKLLNEDMNERPAATIAGRVRFLEVITGQAFKLLDSLADFEASWMEPKKRSVGASERDEFKRADWRMTVSGRLDPERLVFVDEMGANTSLSPIYAYSPVGQRARCSVPRNRGKNTTLLSSMSAQGMGPSLAVDGPTDRQVFEAYLERMLLPTLHPGQTVVMDNLSAHKGERVRELIEERDCELLYLPAYSPELNPIEESLLEGQGASTKSPSPHPAMLW